MRFFKPSVLALLSIFAVIVVALAQTGDRGNTEELLTHDSFETSPAIISNPVTLGYSELEYRYPVEISNIDGFPVEFALDLAPAGMTIDMHTGLIEWPAPQVGLHEVTVLVWDTRAHFDEQSYTLEIIENFDGPEIVSNPITLSSDQAVYSYQARAIDPNALTLQYQLLESPTGMTIDSNTGLIEWAPTSIGQFDVSWEVRNSSNQFAVQSYTLDIESEDQLVRLGGVTSGLDSGSLSLEESESGQRLLIENNGSFSFFVRQNVPYQFQVATQTTEQVCVIDNAQGVALASNVMNVHVICLPVIPDVQELIEEARDELEKDTPPTPDDEVIESQLWQNQMDPQVAARRDRAHALVMSAVDPDPTWFSTAASSQFILSGPSRVHTIELRKQDVDGIDLGPVPHEYLRLEVRLQHAGGGFEWIPETFAEDIVQWSDLNPGQLEVTVPSDLNSGRLVIGVRPGLPDIGQRAIAERWSTALVFEVWPIKPGVHQIDSANVLFPMPAESGEVIGSGSEFNEEEIRLQMLALLDVNVPALPLVVASPLSLSQDELVVFSLDGTPYAGRVIQIDQRGSQQLVFLSPEWPSVYEISNAEDGFLIREGVLPEHVVYRQGDAVEGFDERYRTDRQSIELGPDSEQAEAEIVVITSSTTASGRSLGTVTDFLLRECTGTGFAGASLTFEPRVSLSPVDAGIDITVGAQNFAGECKWEFISGREFRFSLFRAGGPLGLLIQALGGSEIAVRGFGEVVLRADGPQAFFPILSGFTAKASVREGIKIDANFPTSSDDELLDLTGLNFTVSTELGGSAGIRADANIISPRGLIGLLLRRLGHSGATIGIETKVSFGLGAALIAASPAAVAQSAGDEEARGVTTFNFDASVSASELVTNLALLLGGDGNLSIEFGAQTELFRFDGDFQAGEVQDDGRGNAAVLSISPRPALQMLLPFEPVGLMAPQAGSESSVFNDRHNAIEYEIEECTSGPNNQIHSNIVACVGPFCGWTDSVELCGGELWINPLRAAGRTNQLVSTQGQVGVTESATGSGGTVLTLQGQPLDPGPAVITLDPGETSTFDASATCPGSPGQYQGRVSTSAVGVQDVSNFNLLTCRTPPPGSPGGGGINDSDWGDRTWGSPHLLTPDGLAYDYFASGDYVLMRIPGLEGMEIQGRFLPGLDVSWPQAVALQVGRDIVEIHGEKLDVGPAASHLLRIWVNGRPLFELNQWHPVENSRFVALPSGGGIYIEQFIRRFNGRRVDPIDVTVLWPRDEQFGRFSVSVSGLAFNQVEASIYQDLPPIIDISLLRSDEFLGLQRGLLGNHDGDPMNDMMRRNGQAIDLSDALTWTELYALFGADWLVRDHECLFRNGCLVPEFPSAAATLTADQLVTAELACANLTGWFYEACLHDVGLLGSPEVVQALYAATDDLNALAERIQRPSVDYPLFSLSPGGVFNDGDQRVDFQVDYVSGEGRYFLIIRPPRGASAWFPDQQQSLVGTQSISGSVEVHGCLPDPDWQELGDEWPEVGALQLFAIDPLTGLPGPRLGAIDIPLSEGPDGCVPLRDGVISQPDRAARISLSSQTSQALTINLLPRPGIEFGPEATGDISICPGCELLIDSGYFCPVGVQDIADLQINSPDGVLREVRTLTCRTLADAPLRSFVSGMWSGFGLADSLLVTGDGVLWNLSRRSNGFPDLTRRFTGYPAPIHPGAFPVPIEHVVPSERTSLVLLEDGSIWGWGENDHGQLGDGTFQPRATPVRVGSGVLPTSIVSLVVGNRHALALDASGRVWAWGNNSSGQLGDGSNIDRPVPVQLPLEAFGGRRVISIRSGREFSLAVDDQGALWAWGRNSRGQLGQGHTNNRNRPVRVDLSDLESATVRRLSAGSDFVLLESSAGQIWSWGSNGSGQLGREPLGRSSFEQRVPRSMDMAFLGAEQIVLLDSDRTGDIGGSSGFNVALDSSGRLWAWGSNGTRQLGIDDPEVFRSMTPVEIDLSPLEGAEVLDVTLGGAYGFLTDSQERIWGWGSNRLGELGIGIGDPISALSLVGHLQSSGLGLSLDEDDEPVYLPYGSDQSVTVALLGVDNRVFDDAPGWLQIVDSPLEFGRTQSDLIELESFTTPHLALTVNPQDVCTGYGDVAMPITIAASHGAGLLPTFVSAQCGPAIRTGLARTPSGAIITVENSSAGPIDLTALSLAGPIFAAADQFDITVCAGCTVDIPTSFFCSPIAATPLATVEVTVPGSGALFSETLHCGQAKSSLVAVKSASFAYLDGDHWVWGSNFEQGLGIDNDIPFLSSPFNAEFYREALAAGMPAMFGNAHDSFSQVIDTTGKIWGWGSNRNGQLGNENHLSQSHNNVPGFVSDQPVPVPIRGALEFAAMEQLSGGAAFSLGLSPDGRVWAWGKNSMFGQLGDRGQVDQPWPVPVRLPNRSRQVAAGFDFGLALSRDGRDLWSWGDHCQGARGNGEPILCGHMDWRASVLIPSKVLIDLDPDQAIIDIAAGLSHGLALDSDGRVWSWGSNVSGELGLGDTDQRLTPETIPTSAFGGARIASVLAAFTSSFALDELGRLWAWGNNWNGQLALDTTETRILQPEQVDLTFLKGAVIMEFSVGERHSLLLDSNGCYWSWGDNANGQLGDGSTVSRNLPGLIDALSAPGCGP